MRGVVSGVKGVVLGGCGFCGEGVVLGCVVSVVRVWFWEGCGFCGEGVVLGGVWFRGWGGFIIIKL